MAAYEMITARRSWYSAEAVAKYAGVQFDATGKLEKADGTGPFAGVVEYGSDEAGQIATVVYGDYPVVASGNVTVGAKITIDGSAAGKFKVATGTGTAVYGIALTAAAAGELFTLSMLPVATTIA